MKISATLKNNRGGSKVTADDTRIAVELRLGNKIVSTVWLYVVKDWPTGDSLGYRILLDDEIIKEEYKGKQQTDKCASGHICDEFGRCECSNNDAY
jgi:hypothetical protein